MKELILIAAIIWLMVFLGAFVQAGTLMLRHGRRRKIWAVLTLVGAGLCYPWVLVVQGFVEVDQFYESIRFIVWTASGIIGVVLIGFGFRNMW